MDVIKNERWFPVDSTPAKSEDKLWENALLLRGKRLEILSANIANADTPNYKARDIDFQTALEQANAAMEPVVLTTSSPLHVNSPPPGSPAAAVQYRVPYQAALDGNTVETPVEQAAFAENAVRYQFELQQAFGEGKEITELFDSLK